MGGVTDSIELSGLPADVKRMLLKLAPLSFATPVDERHDFQTKVVDMVGEIVVQVQNKMRQDIDAKEEAASERSRAREELLSAVRHAEVAKAEKVSASEAMACSLKEIAKSFTDKGVEMRGAQEEQRTADDKHAADVAAAESFSKSLDAHLGPIVEGHGVKKEAEGNLKALMHLIRPLKLDSSLNSALKTSCTKPCSERSAFDQLVVQELESALRSHLDTLQGTVSSGISGLASRAHAASVTAQKLADEAGNTLSSAQDAVTKFDVERADAERELAETRAEYENFLVWNVECYSMLKDKTSCRSVDTVTTEVSKISEPIQELPVVSPVVACA